MKIFILFYFIFLSFVFLSFVVVVVVVAISWATPAAYGGSQARGWIGAVATGLRQSHSNASATYTTAHGNAGTLTHWARAGTEPETSWFLVGFVNHCTTTGTPFLKKLFICLFILRLNLLHAEILGPGIKPATSWFLVGFVNHWATTGTPHTIAITS